MPLQDLDNTDGPDITAVPEVTVGIAENTDSNTSSNYTFDI